MADDRRRSQRIWSVAFGLAAGLLVADGVAATWSLIAVEPWDWDRFWFLIMIAAAGAVGSIFGEALVERGVLPTRPQGRTKSDEDDETTQALRAGVLPPDADPAAWRGRIRRRLVGVFAIAGSMAVLCITAAALTAASAHLNNDDDLVLWALAVVVLLLPAPLIGLSLRVRHRGQRLLSRL